MTTIINTYTKARIIKTTYGDGLKVVYTLEGNFHNPNGPAVVELHQNGNVWYESYYLNGELHRDDGPACIYYFDNGKIRYEAYFINGELHRENGPTYISYYLNGNIMHESYYINGIELNELEFKNREYKIKGWQI